MKKILLILAIFATSLYSYGQKGILLNKKDSPKTKIIYENARIKLTLNNDEVLRGKFTIVNDSTIAIKDTLVTLSSVVKIKKQSVYNQIVEPVSIIIGLSGITLGVAGLVAGGFATVAAVLIPIGAPFVIVPLVKNYHNTTKWDYEIFDTNAPIENDLKKEKKIQKIINNNPNPLD